MSRGGVPDSCSDGTPHAVVEPRSHTPLAWSTLAVPRGGRARTEICKAGTRLLRSGCWLLPREGQGRQLLNSQNLQLFLPLTLAGRNGTALVCHGCFPSTDRLFLFFPTLQPCLCNSCLPAQGPWRCRKLWRNIWLRKLWIAGSQLHVEVHCTHGILETGLLDRCSFFLTHCSSSGVLHLQCTFTVTFISLTSGTAVSQHLMVFRSPRPQLSVPVCTHQPGARAAVTRVVRDRAGSVPSPRISQVLQPRECLFIPCETE